VVDAWASFRRDSPWKFTVGLSGSSGGGAGPSSMRRKLLRLAQASSKVPSTVKCSSESSPAARAWASRRKPRRSAYLVDFGPGVVRRASAAAARGVQAVRPENLKVAFVTHLHSDHTVGYPDLIFTPWVVGRKDALQVYGPRGLKAMTDHILRAWQEDIAIRTHGLEHNSPLTVTAHEVRPGLVFSDDLVKVTAFPVLHGEWKDAYGYRFDTPDRTIVISGDARPSPGLIDASNHCDILIHEVYSPQSQAPMPDWPKYRALYHTSTSELAEIARQSQPGLLILYHRTSSQRSVVSLPRFAPGETGLSSTRHGVARV
jgi:ribonuclease BN (tRNA processing enzyme)